MLQGSIFFFFKPTRKKEYELTLCKQLEKYFKPLINEAIELTAIFVASQKNSRKKLRTKIINKKILLIRIS